MLPFFRKIRWRLAANNQFFKYSRYAIGEIVLVVVGILIALQINNWNEEQKENEKTNLLLAKVQEELLYNIHRCNFVIDFHRDKDSTFFKIFDKKLTYDDYKSNPSNLRRLHSWELVGLVNKAFTNLEENENYLSKEQDSIFTELKFLYGDTKISVDNWDERVSSNNLKYREKLKNEKQWFPRYQADKLSEEDFEYFLYDPFFFNEVFQNRDFIVSHIGVADQFRRKSINIYKELSDILNLELDSSVVENMNDFKHYIGKYEMDSLIDFHFVLEKNNLIANIIAKKDTIEYQSIDIVPESIEYFRIAGFFSRLIFDENGNVTGLIINRRYERLELKKID